MKPACMKKIIAAEVRIQQIEAPVFIASSSACCSGVQIEMGMDALEIFE